MAPRYIVRRLEGDQRYTVWDTRKNKLAVFEYCDCVDLGFDDAFEMAECLNAGNNDPKKE